MSKLGDADTSEIREAVVEAMVRMASQGSVPAASAVLKVIEAVEDKDAAEQHREKVAALEGAELARYLGEVGASRAVLTKHLGREPDRDERRAWSDGREARRLEVRAIQLSRARAGGRVEGWMDDGED